MRKRKAAYDNKDFFGDVFRAHYVRKRVVSEELFEGVVINGKPCFENFSEEDHQTYNYKKSLVRKQLERISLSLSLGIL